MGTAAFTRTPAEHVEAVRRLLMPLVEAHVAAPGRCLPVQDPSLSGRVLARTLTAPGPLPAVDNSQMDGFAVRTQDLPGAVDGDPSDAVEGDLRGAADGSARRSPVQLPVGITTAAGDRRIEHVPGTASPVMTGAPIPRGADAVIRVEDVEPPAFPALARAGQGVPTGTVTIRGSVSPGTYIRRRGSDMQPGTPIVPAGMRLAPAHIGALVAAGITEVPVRPRIRVVLVTTGDELVPAGDPAGPAERDHDRSTVRPERDPSAVIDANGPMLAAALRGAGCEVRLLRTGDDPARLRADLDTVLAGSAPDQDGSADGTRAADGVWSPDLLVTCGGISAGAFEVVRQVLEPAGVEVGTVALQPGGPQGMGSLPRGGLDPLPDREIGERTSPADEETGTDHRPGLPVLCFPGNPVSALLSCELFLLPVLRPTGGPAGRSSAGAEADGACHRLPRR
jgi:molybdopterin molybdotransferase